MLKGQVAMEFTLIVSFMFVVLIIFTLGILEKQKDLRDEKEFIIVRDIGYKVRDEIALAHAVQPVYIREFRLPENVEGVNYSILVTDTLVMVSTEKQEFSVRVPVVMGCIHKGMNKVTKYTNGTVLFECL